eukprot:Platyproteum_vivax@DN16513_c0_g1_i1.p2
MHEPPESPRNVRYVSPSSNSQSIPDAAADPDWLLHPPVAAKSRSSSEDSDSDVWNSSPLPPVHHPTTYSSHKLTDDSGQSNKAFTRMNFPPTPTTRYPNSQSHPPQPPSVSSDPTAGPPTLSNGIRLPDADGVANGSV